jgi:putative RNA 2'-phosphotransferase
VSDRLVALARYGKHPSPSELESLVAGSDKRRFAFSADRSLIRANQGHTVPVDLGLEPATPADVLFHGTVGRVLARTGRQGLLRGRRHHVHLHSDPEVAAAVGRRRGEAVVLTVDAAAMHRDGIAFYRSANGVWLTDIVPPKYLGGIGDGRPAGDKDATDA